MQFGLTVWTKLDLSNDVPQHSEILTKFRCLELVWIFVKYAYVCICCRTSRCEMFFVVQLHPPRHWLFLVQVVVWTSEKLLCNMIGVILFWQQQIFWKPPYCCTSVSVTQNCSCLALWYLFIHMENKKRTDINKVSYTFRFWLGENNHSDIITKTVHWKILVCQLMKGKLQISVVWFVVALSCMCSWNSSDPGFYYFFTQHCKLKSCSF